MITIISIIALISGIGGQKQCYPNRSNHRLQEMETHNSFSL
jgi:hypothetical protein